MQFGEFGAEDGQEGGWDFLPPADGVTPDLAPPRVFAAPPPPPMAPVRAAVPSYEPPPGRPNIMMQGAAEPAMSQAYYPPPMSGPPAPIYPPPGTMMPVPMQAVGEPTHLGAHMLGLSLIAIGLGGALGAKYGGLWGSTAGALAGGSAMNLYRSVRYFTDGSPDSDTEAQISLFYAFVSAGIAGYIWFKVRPELATRNPDDDHAREPCGLRQVGP